MIRTGVTKNYLLLILVCLTVYVLPLSLANAEPPKLHDKFHNVVPAGDDELSKELLEILILTPLVNSTSLVTNLGLFNACPEIRDKYYSRVYDPMTGTSSFKRNAKSIKSTDIENCKSIYKERSEKLTADYKAAEEEAKQLIIWWLARLPETLALYKSAWSAYKIIGEQFDGKIVSDDAYADIQNVRKRLEKNKTNYEQTLSAIYSRSSKFTIYNSSVKGAFATEGSGRGHLVFKYPDNTDKSIINSALVIESGLIESPGLPHLSFTFLKEIEYTGFGRNNYRIEAGKGKRTIKTDTISINHPRTICNVRIVDFSNNSDFRFSSTFGTILEVFYGAQGSGNSKTGGRGWSEFDLYVSDIRELKVGESFSQHCGNHVALNRGSIPDADCSFIDIDCVIDDIAQVLKDPGSAFSVLSSYYSKVEELASRIAALGGSAAEDIADSIINYGNYIDIFDPATGLAYLDGVAAFIETGDLDHLNPITAVLLAEIRRFSNLTSRKADPIPAAVINILPAELKEYAVTAKVIGRGELPFISIPKLDDALAIVYKDIIYFKHGIPGIGTPKEKYLWTHEVFHLKQYADWGEKNFVERLVSQTLGFNAAGEGEIPIEIEADKAACAAYPIPDPRYLKSC